MFFKGQTGFEFWVLRFRVLGASFSRFGCFVFEYWVLRFRVLGASFSSFGCFDFEFWVLRFRDLGAFLLRSLFSSASFSKLPVHSAVIDGLNLPFP